MAAGTQTPRQMTVQTQGISSHYKTSSFLHFTGGFLSLVIVSSLVWLSFAFSAWMSHVLLPFYIFIKHTPFPLCIMPTPTHSTALSHFVFVVYWPLHEPEGGWVGQSRAVRFMNMLPIGFHRISSRHHRRQMPESRDLLWLPNPAAKFLWNNISFWKFPTEKTSLL